MAVVPTPQRDLFLLPDPLPGLIPQKATAEITALLRELMLSVVEAAAAAEEAGE